jgi:hypothetical protein
MWDVCFHVLIGLHAAAAFCDVSLMDAEFLVKIIEHFFGGHGCCMHDLGYQ